MIVHIHHAQITIPPDQEEQARQFYCQVLGLNEITKPDSLEGRGSFWLQVGGQQVHVGTESDVDRTATKAHIAYQVDDLESWRERFQAMDIEVIKGVPIPGYDRFGFRDPFGNRVEFIQEM